MLHSCYFTVSASAFPLELSPHSIHVYVAGITALDVSRNSLINFEGLSALQSLHSLNAYYNCVGDLSAIERLRCNGSLRVLDLRLNPVSRVEDYRLMVINLLPWLEQLGG